MCGIVAYTGTQSCANLLLEGLKRLEYRGYDSAGLALITPNGEFFIRKQSGKVSALQEAVGNSAPTAYAGIAHTRWATHGAPTHINAHPHLSFNEEIVLVHNGIIENYEHLKRRLTEKGIPFLSETDTEVLCNWIAYVEAENPALSWPEVLRKAFQEVEGTFGIAILRRKAPRRLPSCADSVQLLSVFFPKDTWLPQTLLLSSPTPEKYSTWRMTNLPF
jgi:glucosamine--fructose-6-phosphate aminotransferase (isomerizing)